MFSVGPLYELLGKLIAGDSVQPTQIIEYISASHILIGSAVANTVRTCSKHALQAINPSLVNELNNLFLDPDPTTSKHSERSTATSRNLTGYQNPPNRPVTVNLPNIQISFFGRVPLMERAPVGCSNNTTQFSTPNPANTSQITKRDSTHSRGNTSPPQPLGEVHTPHTGAPGRSPTTPLLIQLAAYPPWTRNFVLHQRGLTQSPSNYPPNSSSSQFDINSIAIPSSGPRDNSLFSYVGNRDCTVSTFPEPNFPPSQSLWQMEANPQPKGTQ
ncbi:hypothetical protein LOD99_13827 [Oopsacas minuta]|uniref:Uncharacterized protein n=1 Tax=Oopsacas minuta TaxID=111878 RepID=A0AAV7KK09_9METZ|nr:hypothetical protein LOD99_13827 [Oopsacas minuta]